MKPKPWSFSALDTFTTCPRQYFEKNVARSTQDEPPTAEQDFGVRLHKAFELRQGPQREPLPTEFKRHEEFMQRLEAGDAKRFVERKVGLDVKAQPCAFFGPQVWWRGVIDFQKVSLGQSAAGSAILRVQLVDYKTGKPHRKTGQLEQFALHSFAQGAHLVDAMFYWTQTCDTTRKVISRDEIPALWAKIAPDLKAYMRAFKEEHFPATPNGLCKGWCPVKDCEHWRPKEPKK